VKISNLGGILISEYVQGNYTEKKKMIRRSVISMYINSNPTHPHICTPGDLSGKGFRVRPSSIISSAGPRKINVATYIVENIYSPKPNCLTNPHSDCL
jgi:hypothetical protein